MALATADDSGVFDGQTLAAALCRGLVFVGRYSDGGMARRCALAKHRLAMGATGVGDALIQRGRIDWHGRAFVHHYHGCTKHSWRGGHEGARLCAAAVARHGLDRCGECVAGAVWCICPEFGSHHRLYLLERRSPCR